MHLLDDGVAVHYQECHMTLRLQVDALLMRGVRSF
jgi:hypothetical protein